MVKLLCAGKAPPQVIPYLCGASLLPCRKKKGGLRPIAVGEVLRRLVSKCLSRAVQQEAHDVLTPLQVGVGVKHGCEAVVHATSQIMNDPSIPPDDRWVLLVDFSNAFNTIDRAAMFRETRSRIPTLAAWMECCYGNQPLLLLGHETISSCSGVQQGDPLGPLGFALTLQPILEKIKAEVPDLLLNSWYLDDGTLCGSPSDLAAALHIIEAEGPPLGLHPNRAKSLLFVPPGADASINPLPSSIPISQTGFTLLGCPLGPPSYCEEVFQRRVDKVKEALSRLTDLSDAQMETTLLRSCLSLPKVSYSLRTCPPSFIAHSLGAFDQAIRQALEDLTGCPLSNWAWLKASLPSNRGGLNLRQASLHAAAGYISSFHQSSDLMGRMLGHPPQPPPHLPSAVSSLALAANRPDWVHLSNIDVPLRQRALSLVIDSASQQ